MPMGSEVISSFLTISKHGSVHVSPESTDGVYFCGDDSWEGATHFRSLPLQDDSFISDNVTALLQFPLPGEVLNRFVRFPTALLTCNEIVTEGALS